jgi:acetyl-CoA carboxylase biotin carboxyl carrier protein
MGQPKNKRPADAPPGLAVVEQLLALMGEHELAEISFEQGDLKVSLKKAISNLLAVPAAALHAPPQMAAVPAAPAAAPQDNLLEIKSPMVGTFYAASGPDSPPFVEVGTRVGEDAVVCIVEAMKVMNEIRAECSGTIEKVCVQNGQAVEYGQVLFKVKPD